jgi:hypothetical protein
MHALRWVRTHDPVPLDDRQTILLESLAVNMDQLRDAVAAVGTYLTSEVGVAPPRQTCQMDWCTFYR